MLKARRNTVAESPTSAAAVASRLHTHPSLGPNCGENGTVRKFPEGRIQRSLAESSDPASPVPSASQHAFATNPPYATVNTPTFLLCGGTVGGANYPNKEDGG
ncbi:hypothetical protein MRX96_059516 [Rhipicephalus microplus]